jgi:hypothetical protein
MAICVVFTIQYLGMTCEIPCPLYFDSRNPFKILPVRYLLKLHMLMVKGTARSERSSDKIS